MNAVERVARDNAPAERGGPQLRTLLLTDLVDSTALVERLGDTAAAELFRAHDRLVLGLQQHWRGRLIDRSDGMLLLFERPIDGLGFALDYTRGLLELGGPHNVELKARAGLHVGEVLTWRNSDDAVRVGAKPVEVEGLAKPMAGRLMTTALPGQILISAVAEPLAHRAARELGERGQHLLWKSHGRWRFKGVPEAQQIFEVGEPGVAPLRTPPNTNKAWRDIPLWRRPAALATEVALLAVIALGGWFIARPQPAIAFNERDWVVLADLRNLTDQPLLDDSLEQAFRISLEQSRHVNVLSDLKTRDTLARMQRAPDTELDRAIASEIAIRDGARAVILPTVAEVGGRVRVSAEVIDPHSQTTVYAEYADGKGAVSALASIDEVTGALREKLGEALEAVEQDSAPLPEVTTENLDALRAYALGEKMYAEAEWNKAAQYFKEAVELDPDFALAYMGILRINVSHGQISEARENLAEALERKNRLRPRDQMYLDAWAVEFGVEDGNVLPRWRMLSELYPDYYAGHVNYAWTAFFQGYLDEALTSARIATAKQNAHADHAHNQVGRILLASGDFPGALESFRKINGGRDANRNHVATLAAMRRFTEAEVALSRLSREELTNSFELIAINVDQGRWQKATSAAKEASSLAEPRDPLLADLFMVIDLAIRTLQYGRDVPATEYLRTVDAALDGVDSRTPYLGDRVYIAMAAAYLGQRAGHHAPAHRALPKLIPLVEASGDPRARQMLEIVRAGQLRLEGRADTAVSNLQTLVDGHELFQVHVALRDALVEAGEYQAALLENDWLAEHRGLAYGEMAGGFVLQAVNVADTTLAGLNSAETLKRISDNKNASLKSEAFIENWPAATLPDHLRRRFRATLPASKQ